MYLHRRILSRLCLKSALLINLCSKFATGYNTIFFSRTLLSTSRHLMLIGTGQSILNLSLNLSAIVKTRSSRCSFATMKLSCTQRIVYLQVVSTVNNSFITSFLTFKLFLGMIFFLILTFRLGRDATAFTSFLAFCQ